jgi:hypothetical protein
MLPGPEFHVNLCRRTDTLQVIVSVKTIFTSGVILHYDKSCQWVDIQIVFSIWLIHLMAVQLLLVHLMRHYVSGKSLEKNQEDPDLLVHSFHHLFVKHHLHFFLLFAALAAFFFLIRECNYFYEYTFCFFFFQYIMTWCALHCSGCEMDQCAQSEKYTSDASALHEIVTKDVTWSHHA